MNGSLVLLSLVARTEAGKIQLQAMTELCFLRIAEARTFASINKMLGPPWGKNPPPGPPPDSPHAKDRSPCPFA